MTVSSLHKGTLSKIETIVFLLKTENGEIFVEKQGGMIIQIYLSCTASQPPFTYRITNKTFFELLYQYGYIKETGAYSIHSTPPHQMYCYEISKKGEEYYKLKYPKG